MLPRAGFCHEIHSARLEYVGITGVGHGCSAPLPSGQGAGFFRL